jgi:signal transduction histidine kinase
LPSLAVATASALRVPYVAVELQQGDETQVIAHGQPGESVARTPLVHQGRVLGALVIGQRSGQAITPAGEQALVENVARQASVAAATVLLTDDLRRSRERIVTAREEERRRLRNDLHDGLGPQLTGIALGLDLVAERCEDVAPAAAESAEMLRRELGDAIADVRRLVDGLRPPRLDEVGLGGALREMAARSERSGMTITVDVPELTADLPAAVEVAAYRIGTEALNNVVRHAAASSCILTLRVGAELVLSVVDDGRGIDQASAGVGMTSMCERAEEVGGTCTFEPSAPSGCRVEARLPYAG